MDKFAFDISAVIINYQTPDLTRSAVQSFRAFYPMLPLLLIDNGSKDSSAAVLQECKAGFPQATEVILNQVNRFHGPAMHQALMHIQTRYVLFLDSDCEVRVNGIIERMVETANNNERGYAVGKKTHMNKRGFDVSERPESIPYIRPICMLLRREFYRTLPPFQHHGAPCLKNMRAAVDQGYLLSDFPIFDYITHKGRGTASRFGYGLGIRGKIDYILNKLGL